MSIASRVSDLAAAIRDKINSMMPRLLPIGGSSGQVLVKSSATNFDVDWIDAPNGGQGWSPVLATGTGTSQDIVLPETGLTPGDVLVFVKGIFQHSGYTIAGNILTTTQPAGFEIMIVRYGVGEKGENGIAEVQIEDIIGLPEAFAEKANIVHTHAVDDVTGLREELDTISAALVNVSDPSAFKWITPTVSQTWLINHNLGRFPNVLTVDDAGHQFFGSVVYNDLNNITVSFAYPVTGTAYLSGTLVAGAQSFQWNSPSASTTWDIIHNLGRYPTVTITDSNGVQFFGAVTYVDINRLTVDFAYAISGTAYLT